MNRRSLGLPLSKAVSGFLQYKNATTLSPAMHASYQSIFKLWLSHVGDIDVSQITSQLKFLFMRQ